MRDGFEDAETGRGRLVYPFAEGPKLGEAVDIAPGVKWTANRGGQRLQGIKAGKDEMA